ncbi:MAG TPA: anhydro-N-acetylmuramic acid kinase [Planctomycetota bacterium]|nr:anhydro-N-acetylmuramic acid kinase [Planctomycetota bacterium]HRR82826.1 anhydro-N-acetylmuramic acid kinase [Planctomycetota bacterium]HRT92946.1 anhydro-N-acetylmuramic acid kinase [Planctomycetota bacterium]
MRQKPELVIGLMSGTSYDGIAAALVAVRGAGLATRAELRAFETYPYPPAVRRLVAAASAPPTGTVDLVCRANFVLGERFAEAAVRIARRARVALGRVALIGSHGQTIHHLPAASPPSTLQIGEPAVIAERTGVTTVADFRPRDVAAGGQGAPLVPYVDYLLLRHRTRGRLVLNIGGIANFTHLPPACRPSDVLAFDTGPGNMLLDALVGLLTRGRRTFDRDGALAARGAVSQPLLRRLLRHPYLRREPPKSTGRETFGVPFAERLLRAGGLAPEDLLATVTAFTAASIADAHRRFVAPRGRVDEVIASGGGCHNRTLMRRLAETFAPVPVRLSDDFGIPADAKEAMAFAILAHETMAGRPGNLPSATGAARPVVLGKIVPGR